MIVNFRKDVSLDIPAKAPNCLIESNGVNHFTVAYGLVKGITGANTKADTKIIMYYPENSNMWNDNYSDLFHTNPLTNCGVTTQVRFDTLIDALIELGTYRWTNILDVPKNMVLILPYSEETLKHCNIELFKDLMKHCNSLGVYVIIIKTWDDEYIDFENIEIHNKFVTVGQPGVSSLQVQEVSLSDECKFTGREYAPDDGNPTYTKHLFLDIQED